MRELTIKGNTENYSIGFCYEQLFDLFIKYLRGIDRGTTTLVATSLDA